MNDRLKAPLPLNITYSYDTKTTLYQKDNIFLLWLVVCQKSKLNVQRDIPFWGDILALVNNWPNSPI